MTTSSPIEAGSTGRFCSHPRVFNHLVQELLRSATKVNAQPARAECFLCPS